MRDFEDVLPHAGDALGIEHGGDERHAAKRAHRYTAMHLSVGVGVGGAGRTNKPVRLRRGYPAMLSVGRILCQCVSSMPVTCDAKGEIELGTIRRGVASLDTC